MLWWSKIGVHMHCIWSVGWRSRLSVFVFMVLSLIIVSCITIHFLIAGMIIDLLQYKSNQDCLNLNTAMTKLGTFNLLFFEGLFNLLERKNCAWENMYSLYMLSLSSNKKFSSPLIFLPNRYLVLHNKILSISL